MNIITWSLTLLFIALKLTNYINWSWIWVLSPFWIELLIAGLFVCCWIGLYKYCKKKVKEEKEKNLFIN